MAAGDDVKVSRRELVQLGGVVAVGWGAAWLFRRAAPIGRDVSSNVTAQALVHDRVSPRQDAKDADLTMVVFTDYQCPACKVASPAMDAAVRRDGRVRVIYRDWPIFGASSERAARVAAAAEPQCIYVALHRHLMAERGVIDDAALQAAVDAVGGDWQAVLAELDRNKVAIDQRIARNGTDAFALSLPGTPAYLIGPILVVGGMDEDAFLDAFAAARAKRAAA